MSENSKILLYIYIYLFYKELKKKGRFLTSASYVSGGGGDIALVYLLRWPLADPPLVLGFRLNQEQNLDFPMITTPLHFSDM